VRQDKNRLNSPKYLFDDAADATGDNHDDAGDKDQRRGDQLLHPHVLTQHEVVESGHVESAARFWAARDQATSRLWTTSREVQPTRVETGRALAGLTQ
jgi:hypothetical protein